MIQLNRALIDAALPRISVGLQKCSWLQERVHETNVTDNREFHTKFNGFHRVRRNIDWQRAFYNILENEKSARRSFAEVLHELHEATGRVEASFASKLAATVDPDKPVIDSIVLNNVGFRLRPYGAVPKRITRVVELHDRLTQDFSDFVRTEMGHYLVTQFGKPYPNLLVTEVKMLDLVLWQTRRPE